MDRLEVIPGGQLVQLLIQSSSDYCRLLSQVLSISKD